MKYCSIYGKEFEGWGNNARPVNEGTCCDNCNTNIVIPRRIQDHMNSIKGRENNCGN
ncbi:MAG: hypothetical protein IKM97_04810 [Clostridia bacterium]|nr:hypothetical protein [Clostridia bacterium]